ncbi:MAG: hypothetical protein IJO73_03655 [Clostridia bacterium]|nr:hypothetical protein [Clostridia bacterium]
MVCNECKKSIAKNSNYCKHCGTKVEKIKAAVTEGKPESESPVIFREIQVTEEEADTGAERILEFDGALEPLHIIFPRLFCTGQLFMVKKFKFLNEQGKKYKKNILIRVNIA